MPANVDGMVREGISAYRAGRKDEAKAFLLKAVEIDEHNEQAWMWLSAVVDSNEEQQICLENVLAINPANERAKQGLQYLKQKTNPPAPANRAEDVLANASFTPAPPASKAAPQVSPFSAAIDDEELPGSIEWDEPATATSSASSRRKVEEPSSAEYDDWVSGLNLGNKSSNSLFDAPDDAPATPPVKTNMEAVQQFMSTSAFDEEDDEEDIFGSDAGVRMPEDLFNSGPFSAPETAIPPSIARRREEQTVTPPPAKTSPTSARSAASPLPDPDSLLEEIEEEPEEQEDEFISEFGEEDFDQAVLEAPDPTEMFRHIPREIKATRLPGTRERYPILVLLGFLVVIAANVGAVAFLVTRLTGG